MNELQAIVSAYEQEKMSPEDIAQDRDLDIAAVKGALMQGSSLYRKACGEENESGGDTHNFSNDDLSRVNQVILDLALGSEDEHLRFKAATYIRNDKKGRLEPAKVLQGSGINVLMINKLIQQTKGVADNIRNSIVGHKEQKAINV
jgi:hypothetical protein